jgi:hypothetical protein
VGAHHDQAHVRGGGLGADDLRRGTDLHRDLGADAAVGQRLPGPAQLALGRLAHRLFPAGLAGSGGFFADQRRQLNDVQQLHAVPELRRQRARQVRGGARWFREISGTQDAHRQPPRISAEAPDREGSAA